MRMKVEAIVPAAGLGLRLKTKIPKPLVEINTKPILIYALSALAKNKFIRRIIIAVSEDSKDAFRLVLDKFRIHKRIDLVRGGKTRRESVENCLKELTRDTDSVLIHDAVRPFLSERLVENCLKEAKKNDAVICGVPARATIKRVAGGWVIETLKREELREIQTPQVFKKELLVEAYAKFKKIPVTDDASLIERLGVKVKVINGSYFNIKITTAEDLVFAQAIIEGGYVESGDRL